MLSRCLFFGESHLPSLMAGSRDLTRGTRCNEELEFIDIREEKFIPTITKRGKLPLVNKNILRSIKKKAKRRRLIFSCIGGNAHNGLGLVNHPRPFDFVLLENPQVPLNEDAEIIPEKFVYEALENRTLQVPLVLSAVKRSIAPSIRFVQLESPPPIPSEAHIRKYPGVFKDKIDELGVAPAVLRYKLWRVHSRLMRDRCSALGLEFLPVPDTCRDASGFMVKEAWFLDPTHGNAYYGTRVLEQISSVFRDCGYS